MQIKVLFHLYYCFDCHAVHVNNYETVTVWGFSVFQSIHGTGLTVEGRRASHRLPAANKKCKHTGPPEKHSGANEG